MLAEIGDLRKLSREDRVKYDRDIKAYRDTLAIMDTERNIGMEQGRAEMLTRNIFNMRQKGLSDEQIADLLDVDIETVKETK